MKHKKNEIKIIIAKPAEVLITISKFHISFNLSSTGTPISSLQTGIETEILFNYNAVNALFRILHKVS